MAIGAKPGSRSITPAESLATFYSGRRQRAFFPAGAGCPYIDQSSRSAPFLQMQAATTTAHIAVDESWPVDVIHMAVLTRTHKPHRNYVVCICPLAVSSIHELGLGH